MWDSLFVNVAVIALVLVAWQTVSDRLSRSAPRLDGLVIGTLLGLGGCLSIVTGEEFLPGILIDLRVASVACAAFFGGPLAALLAGGLTGGLRVAIGGSGTVPALVSITGAALAGLAIRQRCDVRDARLPHFALLALGAAASYGVAYLFIPREVLPAVFAATFGPMFALNFVTTFCFATLSAHELRRQDLVRRSVIFRRMVEFLPDPLIAKDAEGRILAANRAAAAMIGTSSVDDLLGRTDDAFMTPEAAERASREEGTVMREGGMIDVEERIERPGEAGRWVNTRKVAIRGPSGPSVGLVVHVRDITEQRRLLEMKSEFVSLVSHELRTPLTSVRGAVGLLGNCLPEPTPQSARKLLEIAQRNSERLVRLINDILDVEKIENGKLVFDMAPHALAPLVRDALPGYERYMPDQNVTVRMEDGAPGAVARIDADRFEQVLSNLVSNAIKFSPRGGTVTVGLGLEAETVVISVRDEGAGIPEAFRARVFTRFEQSDGSDTRSKGGTGLGLHIAKTFVEKMGGSIGFTSQEGEGTTFFVRLPLAGAPALPTDRAARPPAIASSAVGRVLYIEDDNSLGSILKQLLAGETAVDCVASLEEARTALRGARYDLLLIDDELPDGSGLSLLKELRDPPPAIVFTAHEVQCPPGVSVLHRFVKTRVEEAKVAEAIREVLRRKNAA